jgi:UDP-glucose:(heptosyl)LPS alpha-1,3-glucosyltransferase
MRVGLVRRGFSPTGGAEVFIGRFAHELVGRGHEVILFTSARWNNDEWSFGSIVQIPGRSVRAFADAFERMRARDQCDFVFSFERIWRCDCYRAGDGVHRAWLNRRAQFESWYRRWFRRFNPKHRQILRLESQLLARRGAQRVIANSRMVQEEIVRYYGYPSDRLHLVYNGIPLERPIDRAEARAALQLNESEFIVLFVGTGWERKGLSSAIEAVDRANVPQIKLLVVGKGDPARFPRSSRVSYAGPVRDVQTYFAAADLFLLPTIYDPFSNACLEAAAYGIPVISTSSNGFSEIITPGVHGEVLLRTDDTAPITGAIEKWAEPNSRAVAKPRLIELAQRYDIKHNVTETLRVMENALRERAGDV